MWSFDVSGYGENENNAPLQTQKTRFYNYVIIDIIPVVK
jgi:hypothetical protein